MPNIKRPKGKNAPQADGGAVAAAGSDNPPLVTDTLITSLSSEEGDAHAKVGRFADLKSAFCSARTRGGRPSAEEAELLPERMFEAAWELLLDQGFEGFSFDKLARYARIGKPTIYSRFANKEEFLRSLLEYRVTKHQAEVTSLAEDMPFTDAMALMATLAVAKFLSAEGRLVDRLMDWLDHEGDPSRRSVRRWAFENALGYGENLIEAANVRGEISVTDVPSAARFFLEGIVGHARMSDAREPVDMDAHKDWAERYSRVILKAFSGN